LKDSFTELTFDTLALKPEILRGVKGLGFEKLTPVQAEAVPLMLAGKDVIAQAQTGTGKTAAFGLPILENTDPDSKDVQALILCPTRELAVQVANELRSYASFMHGVKTLPVYGGQDIARQITAMKGAQIIVGTPGRVMDHMRRHTLKLDAVRTVILDEADEMLDMGFREDMETILGAVGSEHQTAMFSATMPQAILDIADAFLKEPVTVQITKEELTIPDITQYYYSVKREYKAQALVRLITYYNYKKCMIFCNMKSTVDSLVSDLQKEGCMAEALHGDLSQFLRDSAMKRFRENDRCVLVATDIAARGIDVGDVEAVFNYDIPQEAEYYVHRIGRTGRAGKSGVSHTLVGSREFSKVRFIESVCHSAMTERTVPTPDEIRESRELQALEEAFAVTEDHGCDGLLGRVRSYCLEKKITPEELCAAFLRLKIGNKTEELDIDLPRKGEGRRKQTGGTFPLGRKQSTGTFPVDRKQTGGNVPIDRRSVPTDRKQSRGNVPIDRKVPARKFDEWNRKKKKEENSRWGNYSLIEEDYKEENDPERRCGRRKDKSFPGKSDKKENNSRSRKILSDALRDVSASVRKPKPDKAQVKQVKDADAKGRAAWRFR